MPCGSGLLFSEFDGGFHEKKNYSHLDPFSGDLGHASHGQPTSAGGMGRSGSRSFYLIRCCWGISIINF